jgi:hypothetical protein
MTACGDVLRSTAQLADPDPPALLRAYDTALDQLTQQAGRAPLNLTGSRRLRRPKPSR